MEPLEWGKDLGNVLLLKADDTVFDYNPNSVIANGATYFDSRLLTVLMELRSIAKEVLENCLI